MKLLQWAFVAVAIATLAYAAGCAGDSSSSSTKSSTAAFPKLVDYDHSCTVASDCTLVRGEGCGSCSFSALDTKAAASYSNALSEASKDPACQKSLQTAGACASPKVEAACEASGCIARNVPADAGTD